MAVKTRKKRKTVKRIQKPKPIHGIQVREFQPRDLDSVNVLAEQWLTRPFTLNEFKGTTLVAQNGKGIQGFLTIKTLDDGTAILENFLVEKSKLPAGKGLIGIKLWREALKKLSESKARRIAAIIPTSNQKMATILYRLMGKASYRGLAHIFIAGE